MDRYRETYNAKKAILHDETMRAYFGGGPEVTYELVVLALKNIPFEISPENMGYCIAELWTFFLTLQLPVLHVDVEEVKEALSYKKSLS